jgi:hypothetical protein
MIPSRWGWINFAVLNQTFADFNMPANAWLGRFSPHIAQHLGIPLIAAHQAVLLD